MAIELTSKKWKAIQLMGVLLLLCGLVARISCALGLDSYGRLPTGAWVWIVITCIGGAVWFVGAAGAWWQHG